MFSYIYKKIRFRQIKNYIKTKETKHEQQVQHFSKNLEENLAILKGIIGNSSDFIIRKFTFGYKKRIQAVLIYIDGLTDRTLVRNNYLSVYLS
jgi:spore germination protein KA